MKFPILLVLLCHSFACMAQVPAYGSSKYIDIASWNLYWYGHSNYGPSNTSIQRAGVAEVIRNSRVDIWFFQEIVDSADLSQVLNESGEFAHVYSDYWQDQKMGIAWNQKSWTLQSDSQLFLQNGASFAKGRFPLFTSLVSTNLLDTLFLIGIHLKAHTGNEQQKLLAYENRKASAILLNEWQQSHGANKIVIAGDWNDDIDQSNYHDTLSPFEQVMDTSGAFLFAKESFAGEHSWYYGTSMIDHIWTNKEMHAVFKANSQKILPLDWYLDSYASNVSDHFPVFAAFSNTISTGINDDVEEIILYPNPSRGKIQISGVLPEDQIYLHNALGELAGEYQKQEGKELCISGLEAGFYLLRIRRGEQDFLYRLVVNP